MGRIRALRSRIGWLTQRALDGKEIFGGQFARSGNIIVRQRGTSHHPGQNVGIGKDHTLFALIDGTVLFRKGERDRSFVSVIPRDGQVALSATSPAKPSVRMATVAPVQVSVSRVTTVEVMELEPDAGVETEVSHSVVPNSETSEEPHAAVMEEATPASGYVATIASEEEATTAADEETTTASDEETNAASGEETTTAADEETT